MSKIDLAFIIDDDEIYVFGLKRIMTIHHLCKNLLIFNNGEEAISYLKPLISHHEQLPDVILLDVNMPVMDGWAFLDEFIKLKPQIGKKITIYMLSSSIDPRDIARAKAYSEVSDYWVKPVKLDELIAALA